LNIHCGNWQQVRRANKARKTIGGIHIDSHHQIEPQERQVSEVILSQTFAAEMSMHTTKTAKAIHRYTNAFEVGKFKAPVITDHYVFHVAAAIDESADLSPGFV
jgi:ABC-type molybdenum transport system ATPase subunit/photorepair protein PhrA